VFAAPYHELTHRHLAMLRAVGAGHCELSCSCEPDLFIEGRTSCDQLAAHLLSKLGLIRPLAKGSVGQRVPARLTRAGRLLLDQSGHFSDEPANGGLVNAA
jgi:hypothetical protein